MSTTAPKPPTKRLFAAACVTGGATLGMFGMIWVGHVVYDNIPTGRLVTYTLILLAGALTTAALAVWHFAQKWRRDAWLSQHALRAEVARLEAERQTIADLVAHIQKADAQVEVTTVLCRKILAEVERERANADTQPIATLRSINGGSSA
ncbi:hypothetical protein [Micromonospora orduensis]|uniref:hypothetical protein n=1 Tax=Micromonospora orduensis TaxID=1420891 RepID=UPI00340C634E